MPVAADTHVHIYPNHDLRVFFESGFRNLSGLVPADKIADTALVCCLTEGRGHHAFRDLAAGRLALPEGYTCTPGPDPAALRVEHDGRALHLVAGRQVVTRERLEVLALTVDADLPDDGPVGATLAAARDAGAVPVLSWSPGKWFGGRGRTIREILDQATPGGLLLGDTTLRPTCWPEPLLMKHGRSRGIAILAGSDPLPQLGEESYVGTYGIVAQVPFDAGKPASSLRDLLRSDKALELRGRRCGPLEMVRRWNRHRTNKPS